MRSLVLSACLAAALALAACGKTPAPMGKWEGVYEDKGLIVAVRLEIDKGGKVRVSAPNAITQNENLSRAARTEILTQLVAGLDKSWAFVQPLNLEFDGEAFRKPGGVAPQLEWDAEKRQMTMIYYSGTRTSVRVKLNSVEEFGHS